MALQSSGTISLSQVQTEFGGANPIGMSEYYAGGVNVPGSTSGVNGAVPASGTISMSKFYGTSDVSFNPSGGTSAGTAVFLYDSNSLSATVTITCNQSATWNWTLTAGYGGYVSVSNGGSSTSISFNITTTEFGGTKEASYTVSGTSGGTTHYWTVTVNASDFS